jgi:hypothetical protein
MLFAQQQSNAFFCTALPSLLSCCVLFFFKYKRCRAEVSLFQGSRTGGLAGRGGRIAGVVITSNRSLGSILFSL